MQLECTKSSCNAVLLMNEGRVVTSGPPERLIEESGLAARAVLPRAALGPVGEDALGELPGVAHVRRTETAFYVYRDGDIVGNIADCLSERGITPGAIKTRPANLDDIYFLAIRSEDPRGGQE